MEPAADGDTSLGAGAPWFLTLFGRDSLWAARMLLPQGPGLSVDGPRGEVRIRPLPGLGAIEATGLRIAGHAVDIAVDRAGRVQVSGRPDRFRVVTGSG